MKIQSKAAKLTEIDPCQIFHFPFGLYAFEDQRSFALVDSDYPPLYWLQSLKNEDLAFLVVDPSIFITDYDVSHVLLDDLHHIGLQNELDENLLSFAIVTLNEHGPTVNLQGPLILNKVQNLGKQVIINDERWSVRHYFITDIGEQINLLPSITKTEG